MRAAQADKSKEVFTAVGYVDGLAEIKPVFLTISVRQVP
jgi:hypothetical protein